MLIKTVIIMQLSLFTCLSHLFGMEDLSDLIYNAKIMAAQGNIEAQKFLENFNAQAKRKNPYFETKSERQARQKVQQEKVEEEWEKQRKAEKAEKKQYELLLAKKKSDAFSKELARRKEAKEQRNWAKSFQQENLKKLSPELSERLIRWDESIEKIWEQKNAMEDQIYNNIDYTTYTDMPIKMKNFYTRHPLGEAMPSDYDWITGIKKFLLEESTATNTLLSHLENLKSGFYIHLDLEDIEANHEIIRISTTTVRNPHSTYAQKQEASNKIQKLLDEIKKERLEKRKHNDHLTNSYEISAFSKEAKIYAFVVWELQRRFMEFKEQVGYSHYLEQYTHFHFAFDKSPWKYSEKMVYFLSKNYYETTGKKIIFDTY